jgi:hypothetical protein
MLNLTDPGVDRSLRSALIVTALVAAVWTGFAAYETSAARAAVSSRTATLETKKSQLDTQDITYRARRRASRFVGDVPRRAPYRGTSAFAFAMDQLVVKAGATLLNIRFGTTQADQHSVSHDETNTFDCTVSGDFPSLIRVVDGFAATTGAVSVTSTDLSRQQVDPKTGKATVQMHIQGKLDQ